MHPVKISTIVLIALAMGAILNIIQFPIIEDQVVGNWRAINNYDSSDLDRYEFAEIRYGFFVALGEVAPGARLIVPPPGSPAPTDRRPFLPRIYGLGRISELDQREYDVLSLADQFDVSSYVVAEGLYGDGSYRIAVLEHNPEELLFLMTSEHDALVVDTRLLPDDVLQEIGR